MPVAMDKAEPIYVRIAGMYCSHCRDTVAAALASIPGTAFLGFSGHTAKVSVSATSQSREEWAKAAVAAVRAAGYETRAAWISTKPPNTAITAVASILAVLGVWFALRSCLGFDPLELTPAPDAATSFGALFLVGLFTSLHCAGMCGGFLLAATSSSRGKPLVGAALYNLGRIGVYTAIGAIAGAAGAAFSFGPVTRGTLQIAAGAFMVVFALGRFGLLPAPPARRAALGRDRSQAPLRRIAGSLAARAVSMPHSARALLLGMANGFMPCGPLQAVQLWALASGSAARGAAAMLVFGLGTAPLLFVIGAAAAFFARHRTAVAAISESLVLVLGIGMVRRGFIALSLVAPSSSRTETATEGWLRAVDVDGVQEVRFELEWDKYPDIVVEAGRTVRLVVHAAPGKITGCNEEFACPALGLHVRVGPGDTVAQFTPDKPGLYRYACWMDMLSARILVEAPKSR